MITLYGKKYAKNKREFTDTLFQADGTANGYYKITKAGVYLSDMQGNERAFIRRDGCGPVTIHKYKGRIHYMFSTSTLEDEWLGTPESYMKQREGAQQLAKESFNA